MQAVAVIALFGALGCLSRYWLSGWMYEFFGRNFPIGTFGVNCLGGFFIGLVMEFSLRSALVSPTMRIGITIGFLGGFTTFSTFSYETIRLLEEGNFPVAAANVFLSVMASLLFTWGGIVTARYL